MVPVFDLNKGFQLDAEDGNATVDKPFFFWLERLHCPAPSDYCIVRLAKEKG